VGIFAVFAAFSIRAATSRELDGFRVNAVLRGRRERGQFAEILARRGPIDIQSNSVNQE
jgi:hypothetical protein